MRRVLKIVLYSGLALALLAITAAITFILLIEQQTNKGKLNQQVQLSNTAFLRVQGTPLLGGDSDYSWEVSYRDKADWEKAGDWSDGGGTGSAGDVIACPLGNVVVVVRTDGSQVFVRTEAGNWKSFFMTVPVRAPFPLPGMDGANLTSLQTPEIEVLRSQMSVTQAEGDVHPLLGQFLPERRELWVDYLTGGHRRFRLRLKVFTNGEKFRLVGIEELPFNRDRPYFDQFISDAPVHPVCNKVEFYRRVDDLTPARGFALLVDPKHPSSFESVEGWRVHNPQDPHPDRIYFVIYGERRLIPTMDTYKNLFGTDNLQNVHLLTKEQFENLPEGDPFSTDAGLWRFADDPGKVYLYDSGEYHWIKNAETLKQYGFDHAPVHDGAIYLLSGHIGEPIGPM